MDQPGPEIKEFVPYKHVRFELSEDQVATLNEWMAGVHQRAIQIQQERMAQQTSEDREKSHQPSRLPYYGAIGGGVTFQFSETSLGLVCKVRESITKEEVDLSEYDMW